METSKAGKFTVMGAVLILAAGGIGCATKKHVRNVVAPIEGRVTDAEKKNAANASAIGELENNVSRVDERVMDVDKKAMAAAQDAAKANQAAAQASQQAADAKTFAESGLNRANQRADQLEQALENRDNYTVSVEETVLFSFNRSTLTKEAKEKLDEVAKSVGSMKHYAIEVQGFTDASGSKQYNLALSQKRADEVVRYLTVQHNIPLRRIHVLGIGEDNPANTGKGRVANQENRRVEVKIYGPQANASQQANNRAAQ
jgi:outer membrane protein OmpA-like peptidoglycan-associated protein